MVDGIKEMIRVKHNKLGSVLGEWISIHEDGQTDIEDGICLDYQEAHKVAKALNGVVHII